MTTKETANVKLSLEDTSNNIKNIECCHFNRTVPLPLATGCSDKDAIQSATIVGRRRKHKNIKISVKYKNTLLWMNISSKLRGKKYFCRQKTGSVIRRMIFNQHYKVARGTIHMWEIDNCKQTPISAGSICEQSNVNCLRTGDWINSSDVSTVADASILFNKEEKMLCTAEEKKLQSAQRNSLLDEIFSSVV